MARRIGDFVVKADDFEDAEAAFARRTRRSRALDRALRAPIPSDVETYEENTRRWDFPGVDTPGDEPRHSLFDFPRPSERASRRGDVGVAPAERSVIDDLGEIGDVDAATMDELGSLTRDLL